MCNARELGFEVLHGCGCLPAEAGTRQLASTAFVQWWGSQRYLRGGIVTMNRFRAARQVDRRSEERKTGGQWARYGLRYDNVRRR